MKDEAEVRQPWILANKEMETIGMPHMWLPTEAFSDNLTTLMFIVASDLNEAQRERLTSSLSLRNMTVIAKTLDSVQTVFVELFCSRKISMENPSLRVSGHGGSASRTFTVENYADEYGQWATDEATDEQRLH